MGHQTNINFQNIKEVRGFLMDAQIYGFQEICDRNHEVLVSICLCHFIFFGLYLLISKRQFIEHPAEHLIRSKFSKIFREVCIKNRVVDRSKERF